MNPRIEVVAIDCLMVRLFDVIAEANMPWMLAATERLRNGFGPALVDLVPSYTTLMVHYDLTALTPAQARALIDQALTDLQPQPQGSGQCHVLPVWYDLSVGPELTLLSQRSGLTVEEVIRRHSAHEYQVFALGFAPGFALWGWWMKYLPHRASTRRANAWPPAVSASLNDKLPRTRWCPQAAGT